jgi:hypothetical protein
LHRHATAAISDTGPQTSRLTNVPETAQLAAVSFRRARALAAAVAIICGCQRQGKSVGELVGTYAIDGALVENTCGMMALPTVNPLNFQVEVRQSGRVGYWQLEKRPAQAGSLEDDGSFLFRSEQTTLVGRSTSARNDLEPTDFTSLAPDFDLQTKNCLMTVRETIEGKLTHSLLGNPFDAGADVDAGDRERSRNAKDLTGYDKIEVSATSESDCSASLAALGGPFLALPCSARYDLEGKLQDGLPD